MKDAVGTTTAQDLARLIAPITPEAFFSEYFEKKHMVIRRDDPNHYGALLSLSDIDAVITQTMVPTDNLQLVNNGNAVKINDYTVSPGFVDPVRVAHHFAQGATVILPQLNRSLPRLAAYCRMLETVFSCDVQTNIYLTPDNAQGFRTHYDSHDVIVLQVHGSKTWRIYESPLELPLRAQAFEPENFTPGAVIDSFVLNAGDMLYVPRGVVHDAVATNEVSLHITTGLLASSWVDVLVEALIEYAHEDRALRASIPPGFANDGHDQSAVLETFHALMRRAAEGCNPARTLDGFASDFRHRRLPVVPGQFLQAAGADGVETGSTVVRRPDLIHRLLRRSTDAGEEIVLEVYDSQITFPAHVEETLRAALAPGEHVVGAWPGDLDEPGQVVLARRLLREGVLMRQG